LREREGEGGRGREREGERCRRGRRALTAGGGAADHGRGVQHARRAVGARGPRRHRLRPHPHAGLGAIAPSLYMTPAPRAVWCACGVALWGACKVTLPDARHRRWSRCSGRRRSSACGTSGSSRPRRARSSALSRRAARAGRRARRGRARACSARSARSSRPRGPPPNEAPPRGLQRARHTGKRFPPVHSPAASLSLSPFSFYTVARSLCLSFALARSPPCPSRTAPRAHPCLNARSTSA